MFCGFAESVGSAEGTPRDGKILRLKLIKSEK